MVAIQMTPSNIILGIGEAGMEKMKIISYKNKLSKNTTFQYTIINFPNYSQFCLCLEIMLQGNTISFKRVFYEHCACDRNEEVYR